jgi:flavin-dependent dehydrogenase
MGGMEEWKKPVETGPIPESGDVFDVIVVGGGPGGSAAASYHAMAGSRVLLLEKEVWPRDKICGDAVGGKSLSHVAELGVKGMIEETPHYRVDSIVFSSSDGSEVRVMLPEEDFERMEAGYALPRLQFDYMMFKQAAELVIKSGGAVIQDFTVSDVVVDERGEGSTITGVSGFIGRKKEGALRS